MGTDFIDKTKRSFDKYLDKQRAKLATADLFTQEVGDVCHTFVADVLANTELNIGDALHAEIVGNQLVLTQNLRVVAVVANPPTVVLQAVKDSYGIATALVQEVHGFAGTAEVTLC